MKYYGFMQDDRYIYFVTELLKGGDLFTYHRSVGNFNAKTTAFYGAQVVSIFEYLQSKEIVYRDLKPENIMIASDGNLQLIDFGFAKVITKRTYTICGTPEYIAPEILLNQGHGKAVDWWTLGILLFEMLAGYPPFQDDDPMNIYRKIINTKPKYPEGFDSKLKSLIKHLLRRDLSKRFGNLKDGAKDIKEHRFFEEINFDDLLMSKLKTPYLPDTKDMKFAECDWEKEKKSAKAVDTKEDPFLDW